MTHVQTQIVAHTLESVTEASLQPFVATLGAGPYHAWLEDERRPDGLRLCDDITDAAEALRLIMKWPQGHLFNRAGHLQWERPDDNRIHLVLIGDGALPTGLDSQPLEQIGEEHLLLWGEQRGGWATGRIPRMGDRYPTGWAGPHASLHVCTYELDWPGAQSVRVITRYLAFQGADHRFSS